MEKELNIAAILKDKPGAKLWSPIIGECTYSNYYPSTEEIVVNFTNRYSEEGEWNFHQSGRTLSAQNTAEVCLFPSKQMRDWSKFAWKKGDVLQYKNGGGGAIFMGWSDDSYTHFESSFFRDWRGTGIGKRMFTFKTEDFEEAYETTVNFIIEGINEYSDGKFNLETLEIEHPNQEFKDGDIVYFPAGDIADEAIFIAKVLSKDVLHSYVYMSKEDMIPFVNCSFGVSGCLDELRLATEEEKQQLFDALAKEGKTWDADKKQIVDLPKKCELKAFDKVLVRNYNDDVWRANIFSHIEDAEFPYTCIEDYYRFCIPYNEETKHLLGTTDDWKGGEENE